MHVEDNEENCLVIGRVYGPGWNDLDGPDRHSTTTAYIVEYGDSPEATPELSSASLLLVGMLPVGLVWWWRRRA